jgi:sugar/nucleoside kinase (ribokinase family)
VLADAFNGALAWALQIEPLENAIVQAVIASALVTTKPSAQPSLSDLRTLEEVDISS